jgi:small-conductance mechanosensitive channel
MIYFATIVHDLWSKIPAEARNWFIRNYKTGLKIVVVMLAVSLFNRYSAMILQRIIEHMVRRDAYPNKSDREKRLNTLSGLALVVTKSMAWVLGALVIIGLLGVNTTPVFASAGLVGAGLAFGAQNLIKDFLAGIFILSENQYRVGDFIEIMGVNGTVQLIGLRTTVLRDLNGSVHHVPNGSIVVATNKTMGYGAINLDIVVASSSDIELVEHVINHVGQRLANRASLKDEILDPPHFARVSDYTGNGITVKITGKTAGGKQLEVKSLLLTELKKSFDEHKIKVAAAAAVPTPSKKK